MPDDSPVFQDCYEVPLGLQGSLSGMEDHQGPVLDLLPGALLVLVFVIGIILGASHGVATVFAVAAPAAVPTTAPSPSDGRPPGRRTFIKKRGEGILLWRDGASLTAAGLAVVRVSHLGVTLSTTADTVALSSSSPPALIFTLPVTCRLTFMGLQRWFQVNITNTATRTT